MTTQRFTRVRAGGALLAGLAVCCLALSARPMTAAAGAVRAASPVPGAVASSKDIKDIRPPYHLPDGWLWIGWLAGAAGLAALGTGWWWWRRSQMPVKTLQELTLERLAQTRSLLESGDARGFSIAVSGIVRAYVEERFQIRALHRTTEEFLRESLTPPESPLRPHERTLTSFLAYCDLAKFARWTLAVVEMDAMLEVAKTLVRETAAALPSGGAASVTAACAT